MTIQNRWLLGLRIFVLICIGTLVAVTISLIDSAGVKAPLLAMMGSSFAIVTLYPPRVDTVLELVQDLLSLVGVGIIITGGMYWLIDAARNISNDELQLILSAFFFQMFVFIIAIYVFVTMLIFADWNVLKEAIKKMLRR